jgi:hypothetical protein
VATFHRFPFLLPLKTLLPPLLLASSMIDMRPSVTLILVILALLVSIVAGLLIGGGPQVWLPQT